MASAAVAPFTFFAELGVIAAGDYLLLMYRRRQNPNFAGKFELDRYVRTSCTLAILVYTRIATTVLQYLQCLPVGNDSVVLTQPSIYCDRFGSSQVNAISQFRGCAQ